MVLQIKNTIKLHEKKVISDIKILRLGLFQISTFFKIFFQCIV